MHCLLSLMATNIYDYALPFVRKKILIFNAWNQSLFSTLQIDSTKLLTDNPDYLLITDNPDYLLLF